MTETPQTPRAQPEHLVVAVLFVVLVVLALWAVNRPGNAASTPAPLSDEEAVAALEQKVRALDGVELVEIEQTETDEPGFDVPVLRLVMTIDLESFTGPQASQDTADRARAALVEAGIRGFHETWVVNQVPGTGATLRVGMDGTGMYSVAAGVGFLDAGATSVLADATTTAVTVRSPAGLTTIAEAAQDLGHGIVSLSTDDSRARYFGGHHLTPPPLPAVALLAEASARDEVTEVSYDAGPSIEDAPAGDGDPPVLTVRVAGDPASTAAWLRASGQAELLGRPIQFVVDGDETSRTGWVSDLAPAGPDPAFAEQDAADAAAAAADGIPACTGPDLTPELVGFDAAAGSRFAILRATNHSGAPCAVDGRPALSFLRASGTEPEVTLEPYLDGGSTARVVVLPGRTVESLVRWGAMSTADDPDLTTSLLVKTVIGADAVRLPVTSHRGGEGGVDILDGATVEVGAWTTPSSTAP
ncbi:DUF4232 domain-containing protein [Oerskovia turbata]|uniref:DUF4232 domain-containing protein n=1 Tax=Oerskovia turbata TaxID=1713 RepID=A0A4Q1L0W7_9CELL|nr:DUF4232 domain-containing protein [Oerskovia turbata]RXR27054.1 DUF4232 domain-containing protein [Oerskovia turbata]RXR36378.1 DUF4232 domain-containing protein [Oerskovia turbata]TGJ95463.1 DUF4232 domain-containing protein [Actinotalea fermentans ATCC 43279 = JCM 9966 = DSM 3133]